MERCSAGGAGGARTRDPGIMSDPNVPLTRTYCTAIARRVQQGRTGCRFLAISGYTPTPIGTGSGHSSSIARGPRSGIWQGETTPLANKTDAEVRFGSPARWEGSEDAVTQGNGPAIAALRRNVLGDQVDDQPKRYCTLLHATIPIAVSLGRQVPPRGRSGGGGGMRPVGTTSIAGPTGIGRPTRRSAPC